MEVNESNSTDDEKYDLISVKIYDEVSYFKDDVKDLSDIVCSPEKTYMSAILMDTQVSILYHSGLLLTVIHHMQMSILQRFHFIKNAVLVIPKDVCL